MGFSYLHYAHRVFGLYLKTDSECKCSLLHTFIKARFGGHKSSFKYESRRKETTLSKYIWELKKENVPYTISWKILARAQPFSPVTGVCQLCTREKFLIAFKSELCTLNSRNELLNSCRHKQTNLLAKTKKKTKRRAPGS